MLTFILGYCLYLVINCITRAARLYRMAVVLRVPFGGVYALIKVIQFIIIIIIFTSLLFCGIKKPIARRYKHSPRWNWVLPKDVQAMIK